MLDYKYTADCTDLSGELRCICLENDIPTLMDDFREWVVENRFTPKDIGYARVIENGKHPVYLADFTLKEDGSIELVTVKRKKLRRFF